MRPEKSTRGKRGKPYYVAKAGSVSVPVYRIPTNEAARITHCIRWHEEGLLKEVRRVDPETAKRFADDRAEYLESAKGAADRLKREQKEAYIYAQDLAGTTPLVTAIKEWKKANELTNGNLIAVAKAWSEQRKETIELHDVNEVVKRFLVSKSSAGFDIKASYARTLPKFQKDFGKKIITTITARRLQDWLDKCFDHPVTRNTHRKRIVTLWTWARAQGYLPRTAQTEAELTHRAREEAPEIGIIKAKTYLDLLNLMRDEFPQYLGAAVLAGFCGMRRSEVHGQRWNDIDLERKFVRISSAKRGTPAKRLVTLCDTAIEWLMISPKKGLGVCPGSVLSIDRIRKLGRAAGLDLPANCFRHSYISCRVAATGEIDRTALEAGTSARMIHRHYRELVTKEEGEDWFSIRPFQAVGKVVEFGR